MWFVHLTLEHFHMEQEQIPVILHLKSFQMISERKLVPYMGFSVPRYSHTVAAMSE